MSIVGVGNDIVDVGRVADLMTRHADRFLKRCFRTAEIAYIRSRGRAGARSAAARWCAKEAFLKALGQDVRSIPYADIEVQRAPQGMVTLLLHGRAARAAERAGVRKCHVSLAHERTQAMATVILEK